MFSLWRFLLLLLLLASLPPGPTLQDDVLFPFAFHLCFLELGSELGLKPTL